jgi:hypothetical protein
MGRKKPSADPSLDSGPPRKKDAAYYLTQGLIWVGVVGGLLAGVVLHLVQGGLDANNALNTRFKDAPVWVPAVFLIAGPFLGLLYFAMTKKPDGDAR